MPQARRSEFSRSFPTGIVGALCMTAAVVLALTAASPILAQEWVATGTYTGNNAPGHTITDVGFWPDVVIVKGNNNQPAVIRMNTMSAGVSRDLGDIAVYYNNGIFSLDADGFTLGSHNAVNETGVEFQWVAMREESGVMDIGTYYGNGWPDHFINVSSYQPDAGLVMIEGDHVPQFRHIDMPMYSSAPLVDGGMNLGGITGFYSGGFNLGDEPEVNAAGWFYHYIMWKNTPGLVAADSYLGDSQDDRVIAGLDLSPAYLFIKSGESDNAVHRPASLAGDASQEFIDKENQTDRIQSFLPNGFELGKNNAVNDNGRTFYWVGFANLISDSDLAVNLIADTPTAAEGDTLTFQVHLDNLGPEDAKQVRVEVPVPVGTSFLSAETITGSYDPVTGLWGLGTVDVGAAEILTLRVTVDAGAAGTTVTAAATATGNGITDVSLLNNEDTVSVDIFQTADLDLAMGVDNPAPAEGDTLVFTTRITSVGPGDATGVQLTDLLPPELEFIAADFSRGTYDDGTGLWDLGDFAAADEDSLVLTVRVATGTQGTDLTSTAAITASDAPDPNPSNDTAQVTVPVTPIADLAVTAAVAPAAVAEGDTVLVTVAVANAGPADVASVQVVNVLPAGLILQSFAADTGTFTEGTGTWELAALTSGAADTLVLETIVDSGTAGNTLLDSVSVTAAGSVDPDPADNTASGTVDVYLPVDLALSMSLDEATPAAGDTVRLTVIVANTAGNAANGIEVTAPIPAGLELTAVLPTTGSFDDVLGVWTVGTVNPASADTLYLDLVVQDGTQGTDIGFSASISDVNQPDSLPDDNTYELTLAVKDESDLYVSLIGDKANPAVGDTVRFTAAVNNAGPADDADLVLRFGLPAAFETISHSATAGAYDPDSGAWDIAALAADTGDTLTVLARIAPSYESAILTITFACESSRNVEVNVVNNAATVLLTVQDPAVPVIVLTPLVGEEVTLAQGDAPVPVLRFEITNEGGAPDTLDALTVTNMATGPYTQEQLDSAWQGLTLLRTAELAEREKVAPVAVEFNAGTATFAGLDWALDPGRTVTVTISGAPSNAAPDSLILAAEIADPADIDLAISTPTAADWPLASGDVLIVDGFAASLMELNPVASRMLAVGSRHNLALEVNLPANGFLPDELNRLNIVNLGTAVPGADIDRMEAWSDDGDLLFDAAGDQRLGDFVYTGDRWELTGLTATVPVTGLRVFVTVDVTETAEPAGNAVRLSIPGPPDEGVGMLSTNDGPMDASLDNPFALGISVSDRIILTSQWIHPGVAFPAATNKPLLHLKATNTYPDARMLQGLTVTNTTVGSGGATTAQLDATCRQIVLRLDGDADGTLDDAVTDPPLAGGAFTDGAVSFAGLALDLPAGESVQIFVVADLGLDSVADGDVVSAVISAVTDVDVGGSTIVGDWPLDSGARWSVDGMIADQVGLQPITVLTLGPDDGPALAMDVTVPANGYRADQLLGVTLLNTGTADTGDLAQMELWEDGGDGLFDAGVGDDLNLGAMSSLGGTWLSPVLDRTIDPAGLRLFVSLDVSATPEDSATVRLAVPVGGLRTESGNSGPLDRAVVETGTLVLSTSPILSSVDFTSPAGTEGQSGEIRMTVSNRGGETVVDITPDLAIHTGDGTLTLGACAPPSFDLIPGADGVFTWSYTAETAGGVVLAGGAHGTGDITSLVRRSIATPTSELTIFTPVPRIELYPVANLPFSINRGQTNIVPITMTLANPGDAQVADGQLTSFRISLLETPEGPPLIPSNLLDRLMVSEGTDVYLSRTVLPDAAGDFELVLDRPVHITGAEPVTLGLHFDLAVDSTAPSFLVSIDAPDWFAVSDAVSGNDVPLVLGDGAFPIRSGQGELVTQATSLLFAVADRPAGVAGPDQTDVVVAELDLSNVGADDSSSAIEMGSLALAFRDSNGTLLADPTAVFSQVRLQTAFQMHFAGPPVAGPDSLFVVILSPPVLIPGNTTFTLRVSADVAENPPLGPITFELGDLTYCDARDANTGAGVAVVLDSGPAAAPVLITGPAELLQVSGEGRLPATVPQGASDVEALAVTFLHPGGAETAGIACDTLTVTFFDSARRTLDPGEFLDSIQIRAGEQIFGTVVRPEAADGAVAVPLTGCSLAAGASLPVALHLDFMSDVAQEAVELVLATDGIAARDVVRGAPVTVEGSDGTALVLSSGLTVLVAAADELIAGGESRMPAILAPQPDPFPVLAITLRNPAGPESGAIEVSSLTFEQLEDGTGLGAAVARAQVRLGTEIWAVSSDLAPGDEALTLTGDQPLLIPASDEIEAVLELVLRSEPPPGELVLSLDAAGIAATGAHDSGSDIYVMPAAGQAFPLVSEKGNLSAADLESSYANFPNPFAAGREATTFVYTLADDARVTLRVLTPYGESVTTLLEQEPRAAGLHQTDLWDGHNGRGKPVHNGVYLAELVVEYDDGTRQRVLRKVAVVR